MQRKRSRTSLKSYFTTESSLTVGEGLRFGRPAHPIFQPHLPLICWINDVRVGLPRLARGAAHVTGRVCRLCAIPTLPCPGGLVANT